MRPASIVRWPECWVVLGLWLLSMTASQAQVPIRQPIAPPGTPFYVWQGFDLSWTYNHRLNRLASLLIAPETPATAPSLGHAAATGKGADSGRVLTQLQQVIADGVMVYGGVDTLWIEGREGDKIGQQLRISFAPMLSPPSGAKLVPLLAGFDLLSLDKADKLQELYISVSRAHWDSLMGTLHLTLAVEARLDCRSLECPWFNKTVNYQIAIGWQLLVMEPQSTHWQASAPTIHQPWPKKLQAKDLEPQTAEAFSLADGFLGLDIVHLKLNQSHWLAGWTQRIEPGEEGDALLRTQFRQSLPDMKRNSASRKHARCSKYKAGEAWLTTGVVQIQAPNLCFWPETHDTQHFWPGGNRSATAEEASQALKLCLRLCEQE